MEEIRALLSWWLHSRPNWDTSDLSSNTNSESSLKWGRYCSEIGYLKSDGKYSAHTAVHALPILFFSRWSTSRAFKFCKFSILVNEFDSRKSALTWVKSSRFCISVNPLWFKYNLCRSSGSSINSCRLTHKLIASSDIEHMMRMISTRNEERLDQCKDKIMPGHIVSCSGCGYSCAWKLLNSKWI